MYEVCEKSTWKVLIKQDISVIGQILILSFSRHGHRRYARTFHAAQTIGGARRSTSRRWQFRWPLPRSSWGSPGSARGQPAAHLPLETRRSTRGRNSAKRVGRRSAGWRWRRTSSWRRRHWWLEICTSPNQCEEWSWWLNQISQGLRQEPWWCLIHLFVRRRQQWRKRRRQRWLCPKQSFPLIRDVFHRFRVLDYGINWGFLQRLFTIRSSHCLFYLLKTFAGDSEPRREVAYVWYACLCARGRGK